MNNYYSGLITNTSLLWWLRLINITLNFVLWSDLLKICSYFILPQVTLFHHCLHRLCIYVSTFVSVKTGEDPERMCITSGTHHKVYHLNHWTRNDKRYDDILYWYVIRNTLMGGHIHAGNDVTWSRVYHVMYFLIIITKRVKHEVISSHLYTQSHHIVWVAYYVL